MHVLGETGVMKCVKCGRTDNVHTSRALQCTCYTWFVYTCAVCLATVLIGLACCAYCTYMLVLINDTVGSSKDKWIPGSSKEKWIPGSSKEKWIPEQKRHLKKVKQFQNNRVSEKRILEIGRSWREDSLSQGGGVHDMTANKIRNSRIVSREHISKIRRKRKAEDEEKTDKKTKEKKRRKGKGVRGKKKQKVQAAHFFLRQGLAASSKTEQTLEVFQLATFIKSSSNPFIVVNGRFYARKKGLYLVYAQILFESVKVSEVMKIVQNRVEGDKDIIVQEHYCFVSVPKVGISLNNTCNIVALFFLEANDYLSMLNYYPEVHISYTSNSTFFGAVYLR